MVTILHITIVHTAIIFLVFWHFIGTRHVGSRFPRWDEDVFVRVQYMAFSNAIPRSYIPSKGRDRFLTSPRDAPQIRDSSVRGWTGRHAAQSGAGRSRSCLFNGYSNVISVGKTKAFLMSDSRPALSTSM